MVPEKPEQGPSLSEIGETLAEARYDHAEAFLFYLNEKEGRTVAESKAMADVAIDLAGAEVAWRVKLEELAQDRADFYLELLRAAVEFEDGGVHPKIST